jgi:vanillate O-demethylase monooxygenase subunit
LPEVPEFSDPQWKFVETGPFRWKSASARQLENFTDFAHFPFVHPNILGDPNRTEVPGHKVRKEGNVLIYEVVRPEAPNNEEFPIFANPNQELPERHSRYRLYLPYTIVLRIGWSGTTRSMFIFFASQPINATECIGYCIIGNNYGEINDENLKHFEEVIFGQDQVVVESQRPEQVPFDLAAEIHLPFDAVAIAYRKAMKDFGFD